MRVTLNNHDLREDCCTDDLGDDNTVDIYWFTKQAQVVVKAAGGGKYKAPDGKLFDIKFDPVPEGKKLILVPIEVTEDDRKAAVLSLLNKNVWGDSMGPPMNDECLLRFCLIPALHACLGRNRERLEWNYLVKVSKTVGNPFERK